MAFIIESWLIILLLVLICGVYQRTLADDVYDQNSIDTGSGSERAVLQCILTTKRTSEERIHENKYKKSKYK